MRPLFTIHAGEYVVGEYIQHSFPGLNIWIPAKDTGIDLLVTGKSNRTSVSIQVKLSRDYNTPEAKDFDGRFLCTGWLHIDHDKLANSIADLWVIVLLSNERRQKPQYIVIPPQELLRRLIAIHDKSKRYNFYPWVTKEHACLEGRGLSNQEIAQLFSGTLALKERDLSEYLNNWNALQRLEG